MYLTKTKIKNKIGKYGNNQSPLIKINTPQNKSISNPIRENILRNYNSNKNSQTKLPEIWDSDAKIVVNKTLDFFQNEINKTGKHK